MGNMKKISAYTIISMIYILVTSGMNLFGYMRLPAEIATQISFSGEAASRMPKGVYLLISLGAVTLLSLLCIFRGREQKLKFLLVNSLLVIVNIAVIVIQV